jgi:gliding motility-associated-like protein
LPNDTALVFVIPQPIADAGQDVNICSGGTVQLGAAPTAGFIYSWTPTANLSDANISNPTFRFSNQSQQPSSFTYILNASVLGCNSSDTVTITVDPAQLLNVTVNGNAQFCEGESVTLVADAGLNNYTWNDGTQGASYTITSAGSYFVTAENAQGCEFISSATPVIVFEKPEIALGVLNNVSCFGFNDGNASFVSTGGTPAYQYFFDDGTPIQGSTAAALAPANYTVIVFDGVQCSDTISFTITEPSTPLGINLLQLESVRCFGESSGNILVAGTGGTEPYSYLWSNSDTDANAGGIPVGNYIVTVTDANGCTETDSYDITQPEPIVVTIQPEYEVLLGNTVVLEPNYGGNDPLFFNWSPDVYLSNATIDTPTARPFQTTTYTITVSDTNQCEASASTTVFVNDSIKIYIPNIFSPNADGVNDVFLVYANAVKDIYVTVFNRWGEKVFESKDITLGWDGTYKGKLAPEGVYVYYVQFTFLNFTQQKKKGSITLVR